MQVRDFYSETDIVPEGARGGRGGGGGVAITWDLFRHWCRV